MPLKRLPPPRARRLTTRNAAAILTALDRHADVPLHAGRARALERPALHAPTDIHGVTGLDGSDLLPEPACEPSPVPAVDAMAAALFRACPDLVAHVRGLSLLGGSLGGGFSDAPMGRVGHRPRVGNAKPSTAPTSPPRRSSCPST